MVRNLNDSSFCNSLNKNCLIYYSQGQLVFGYDMILPIKHMVDWELTRQQKQTQSNKYNIQGNYKIVGHDYKVVDEVILDNNDAYTYENPYKAIFDIKKYWTNSTLILQCGVIKIRYNIPH